MKQLKKIGTIMAWVIAGILLLTCLMLLFLQTPLAKRKIADLVMSQVNANLNGQLHIGKLEGNFFNGISLSDVVLTSKNDTVAEFPHLQLHYRLRPLLSGKIVVDRMEVQRPYVYLQQYKDATWNVEHLIKPSEKPNKKKPSAFRMTVDLQQLRMTDGQIKINALSTVIPKKIERLNIDLSGKYSSKEQFLYLRTLSFLCRKPDLELKNLRLEFIRNDSLLSVKNLVVQTAHNKIISSVLYDTRRARKFLLGLKTEPIRASEFSSYLPAGIQFTVNPTVQLSAEQFDNVLNVSLNIAAKTQLATIELYVVNFPAVAGRNRMQPVRYQLICDLHKINAKDWIRRPTLNCDITGRLLVKGSGLNLSSMEAEANGMFSNLMLQGKAVSSLNAHVAYRGGSANVLLTGKGGFGKVQVQAALQNILTKSPRYQIRMDADALNLAVLSGNKNHRSDINLNLHMAGSGFNPHTMQAKLALVAQPSSWADIRLQHLSSEIRFVRGNILIDTLDMYIPGTVFNAHGNYNLYGRSDLTANAILLNADQIMALTGVKNIRANGRLQMRVTGFADDLSGVARLEMDSSRYHDFRFDGALADMSAHVKKGNVMKAEGNVTVHHFATGGVVLDSICLQASSDMKQHKIHLDAAGKELKMKLISNIETGETTTIGLQNLHLDYKKYSWNTIHPAQIQINPESYHVDNLEMASQRADTIQRLFADGWIRKNGLQNLKIDVDGVDVAQVMKLFGMQQDVTGRFSLNGRVEGPADAPRIFADMHIQNGRLNQYKLDTLSGYMQYIDNLLKAGIQLSAQDSIRLSAEGSIPSGIRFDTMTFDVAPKDDTPVLANVLLQKLPLAMFKKMIFLDSLSGIAESKIAIDGTLKHLVSKGNLRIRNASVGMQKYGVDYKDIQANILLDDKLVKVDTFLVRSQDGYLTAGGQVRFNSEIYKADVDTSTLKLYFNKFNPVNHKQFNMEVTGTAGLTGNKQAVQISGDLAVPQSYFYLPAILQLAGQSTAPEIALPLLVEAAQHQHLNTVGIIAPPQRDSVATARHFAYFDNLQGKIKVTIPRNTWVKNDDMRMELSGDLDLVKHLNFFELFGTVDVVRGQYVLLGRTFVVNSGQITFQGGEKMNPQLALDAQCTFRDKDKNSRVLGVVISGDMMKPEIKFTIDDASIGEGDALAYILFGTSMDALGSGQQEAVSSSGLSITGIAQSSAASLISAQLTKLLGNLVHTDYLEFKAGGAFDNASLVMGKYLTNNLFVSYEQHFGNFANEPVQEYEVRLEYQLFKFLFVQLVSSPLKSGADLIFKLSARQ